MGYAGKLEEKKIALRLRKHGLSYSQIRKRVNVSKDTLSRWCKNVVLSPQQMEKLARRKITGSEKGRIIGAKTNQKKRIKEEAMLLEKGISQVASVSERDRFIAGIALYMSDGSKAGNAVEFTNSNPKMIKFMADWFKEFCKIDNNRIRISLWIHDNLDENKAKHFWSQLIGISLDQFHKSYIAKNKINSKKIRKMRHEYGVCKIRFFDVKQLRLIKGWIEGVLSA